MRFFHPRITLANENETMIVGGLSDDIKILPNSINHRFICFN